MSGLIQKVDGSTQPTENVPQGTAQDFSHQHENPWFIDEGMPGTGPRPEWLDAKFKTVRSVVDSYKELEKRLGSNQAPENYDLGEFADHYQDSPDFLSNLTSKAKSHKLSQDAFKDVISELTNYQKSLMPNTDEEMRKLGENPQRRLDTVNTWATNHLSEKALDTLGKISYTADVVELMDEIRQLHFNTSSKVPVSHNATPFKPLSVKEVEQEMFNNREKYMNDSKYRAEIQDKFAQAVGDA